MASAWSKPLKAAYTINKALVAQSIAAETPVGDHSHDDRETGYRNKSRAGSSLRRNYASGPRGGWPREGGRLQRYLGLIQNWKLQNKGRACYINVFLPYVRILNFGGPVSPVAYDKNAWRMHFYDEGEVKFSPFRKGYNIRAQHFIERGVAKFAAHGGNAIHVEWAKGTDTA